MSLDEMIKQVEDFEQDRDTYNMDVSYPGFEFSKNRRNYQNILKRLKTIQLPNPEYFKYSNLSIEELKEYLSTILNKIFNSAFQREVESYNSILVLVNNPNCFDATLESETKNGISLPKKIYISNKMKSIQVASTAHEYMHALLAKYSTNSFNKVLSNYHYKELLSILIEYVTIYELSEYLKQEDLKSKHNIIRLNHDQVSIKAHEDNKSFGKTIELMNFSKDYINGIKKCIEYSEHNACGYIISDIYASRLFDFYQDDPKKLTSIWTSILHGEESIEGLLDYYGVSLRDQETSIRFQKRLEKASIK